MGLSHKANPARYQDLKRGLSAFVAERPRGNHKALPWRQVPALMKRLRANHSLSSYALQLTILAVTRTSETLGARFSEFSHGRWTIPAERMKGENGKRRAHRVPITSGIERVLADLEYGRALSPQLFANPSTGEPLSNMAMLVLLKGMGIDATVHGFRSSFRDWAAEQGYPREIAEAALAHVVSGVEGAYFRSDLFEQRRVMMEAWATFCLGRADTASQPKVGRKTKARKNLVIPKERFFH
jgi:integrase